MVRSRNKSSKSKRPTHYLKMKVRELDTGYWQRIGAVWTSEGGYQTLKLSMGVILDWRDHADYIMVLVPNDDGQKDA